MKNTTDIARVGSCDLLDEIDRALNHAYESGYISGGNDKAEGCFNEDTAFVAQDRCAEIRSAVRTFLLSLTEERCASLQLEDAPAPDADAP